MASELPETVAIQFGIRTYEITDYDFLHPADLIDKIVKQTEVSKVGAFVGRLKNAPSPSEVEENIVRVKDLVQSDENFRIFSPSLLKRSKLCGDDVFAIISTGEGSNARERKFLRSLRQTFRQEVLHHDFVNPCRTKLEADLDSGVGPFLDGILQMLRVEVKPPCILYAANMDIAPPLRTTKTVAMKDMTSFIKHLPGGRHVGIVSPTVYVGSEGATFNCHREDCSFEGMNRHISGAPKVWFLIPPAHHNAFCLLLSKFGLTSYDRLCVVFIQHKFVWVDPRFVISHGIPVHTIIQRPGDIVYVLPNCIHWGANSGLNVNEAVNVASSSCALPLMLCPPRCQCSDVAGYHYEFDCAPVLKAIGVEEDTIQAYKKGILFDISEELRMLMPQLHPELGRPDRSSVKVSHLLGEHSEWDKPGRVLTRPSHDRQQYIGGFDLIDLCDDEEEESVIGEPSAECQVVEGAAGEGESSDESQLDIIKGTYKCSQCEYDSFRYGVRGAAALKAHILKNHLDQANHLIQNIAERDARRRRQFSSEGRNCDVCGSVVRGGAFHLERHQQSRACKPLQVPKRKKKD